MRVYIGIPLYGGAGGEFISALLKTRVILDKLGYEVEVDIHQGCSVITKARNDITHRFYASGFDVLLFIDADMAWNPVDAVNLLRSDHEFSAIAYRGKVEEPVYHCLTAEKEGEWLNADAVGTGFIALKRSVIEKMLKAYPETAYVDNEVKTHALFDFDLHQGRYWGEDYTFCRRWKAIGGEIKVLADATIKHIGNKAYTGNFAAHLREAT